MPSIFSSNNLQKPTYSLLFAVCVAHLFNDLLQSVIPAIYPRLEDKYDLNMAQIGVITLCFQLSASIFQPVVGAYTDKHPKPYSQMIGMLFSTAGMISLAYAANYEWILISVILVGIGSSIFHPESSRVAYMSAGGRRSFAQAMFQIGGNTGAALAPLLIAWIVIPNGQQYILWFAVVALCSQVILGYIGRWYSRHLENLQSKPKKAILLPDLSAARINWSVVILLLLIFSKYFYTASITSYFQFYTIDRFGLTEVQAQVYLFYFLIAVAVGSLVGGLLGDYVGRKYIIWFSVLGAAPFTLLLPYVDLFWTGVLIVIIGLIISSAFAAILVFAQELLPRKLGMISGLFYGFAFGMGGLGSAFLGWWADQTSIDFIYHVCSYLPLMGIVAYFLPDMKRVTFRPLDGN